MAWLGTLDADRRSTAEAVEEALYRHRQPLFGTASIAFFDTTSLWFEGAVGLQPTGLTRGGESLGQRGHSKDYRGHLKQVVLGIVLDDADRPIASFLMPGNTADVTMLVPVVRRLRERFGITKACIVADRGMISPTSRIGAIFCFRPVEHQRVGLKSLHYGRGWRGWLGGGDFFGGGWGGSWSLSWLIRSWSSGSGWV